MTQLKHVLILTILILPMFALAPTLVTSPNEVLTNRAEVETSLPAQFVEETLRVAVYAEDNTTLPAYSLGGVPTDHYMNVIHLLQTAGYAVTALTTQDILDHKLMVADFDVFVLPNQLPRESIINPIKDYWLGGGGILNFGHSVGFCFYAGIIDSSYEGSDQAGANWVWMPIFPNITIEDRHPVTKAYDAGERFVQPGNLTFFNPTVISTIGDRFIPLGFNDLDPAAWNLWALNNPNRGGKFVHLPGNCSVISSWLEPIIIDAVDWLTPRPKGRILFDLSHNPYVSLDLWDPYNEPYPMMSFRNGLVNHTYSVDKLRTDLTLAKLAPYDMLVVPISTENFTAAEIEMVRTWVMNGGSLFVLADQPFLLNVAAVSDYLISPYDISVNLTAGSSGFAATAVPPLDLHPLHENALYLEAGDSAYLNITGDAYPLWFYDGNIVGAGQEYGEGRVIVSGDINMACDGLDVLLQDNYNYLLNVANWLTAAKAKILVYADHSSDARDPNKVPLKGPVAQALNDLGVPFYMTSYDSYFNMSLFYSSWDMVIFDNNAYWTGSYQLHLMDFVEDGGKLIMSTYSMSGEIDAYFGIDSYSFHDGTPETLYVWNTLHPVFTNPVLYGADNVSSTLDVFGAFGTYALDFNIFANATAIAGFTPTAGSNAGIILSAEGRAIMNGPLLSLYGEDTDDSTYMDAYELWLNEIGFLYFERPTINHPADMTYMETETGNEISWTPVADAGPWEYVVRENGSIIEADHWGGGTITINVDGVNASLTDYQLTVFDNLGYSASDVVVLNVTEFTSTSTSTSTDTGTDTGNSTGGGSLDTGLLLIIGVAAAGVVIIIIIMIQLKKKK